MRRTFADVIKNGQINFDNEYSKFYNMFYKANRSGYSIASLVNERFLQIPFRGTCMSLEEFDEIFGFYFEESPNTVCLEELISFMEYIYNFTLYASDYDLKYVLFRQLEVVTEQIGYQEICGENGVRIFVPKDATVNAVVEADSVSEGLSYKILEYNHHSLSGDLESKKEILLKLSYEMEPKRNTLKGLNKQLADDLFFLINKCNIRHNNKERKSANYYRYIDEMSDDELEAIYDEIYRMFMLAFLTLEHGNRKEWLDNIKKNIETVK